jgi:hypothetical protein
MSSAIKQPFSLPRSDFRDNITKVKGYKNAENRPACLIRNGGWKKVYFQTEFLKRATARGFGCGLQGTGCLSRKNFQHKLDSLMVSRNRKAD